MLQILQIIALLQGFFVLSVLYINRSKYKQTPFWLLFLSLFSVLLYIIGDDDNNIFVKGADWFLFDCSLFITFLFLFFRYFNNKNEHFQKQDYIFFLPNIIYFIIEAIEIHVTNNNLIVGIIEIATEVTFFSYLAHIIHSIIKAKKRLWLLYFVTPIAVLFGLLSLNNILMILNLEEFIIFNNKDFSTYLLLIIAFLYYFIAFYLINKDNKILPKKEVNKYKKSTLSDTLISQYKTALVRAMETDKLYLNGKLSIHDVSTKLNIPRQYISEVLNNHMSTNFQDFVNNYRVEAFIDRLKNDQNNQFTLLAIATDVGFNSKSSFNAIFKKTKGLTPTQFKKSLIANDQFV